MADIEMPKRRSDSIDGFRGIAVSAVLLFHGGYAAWGWLGVPIFFMLSGYLLTQQLHQGMSIPEFWTRRARRIIPLFYAYLLINLVLAILTGHHPDGYGWHFFGLSDRLIAVGSADQHGHIWHLWSIAVEIQAYAIMPFVVRHRPIVIAIAIASLGYWSFGGFPKTLSGNAGFFAIGALLSGHEAPRWKPHVALTVIGRAGYSIYLWQMLCIAGATRAGIPFAAIPLSLIAGFVSWRLFEHHGKCTSPVQLYTPPGDVNPYSSSRKKPSAFTAMMVKSLLRSDRATKSP